MGHFFRHMKSNKMYAGAAAVTTNAAAKALTNTFFIAFIVIFPPFVFGIIYE